MKRFVEGAAETDWYREGPVVLLLPDGERDHWHGWYAVTLPRQDYVFTAPDGRNFRFPRDDDERKTTHYDRGLRALQGAWAAVRVGASMGLLVYSEGSEAKWLPFVDRAGGVVASLAYTPSEDVAVQALAGIPEEGWAELGSVDLGGGTYCLQDAGRHGREPDVQRLSVELLSGTYAVSRLDYAPDAETCWHLHRVERVDD